MLRARTFASAFRRRKATCSRAGAGPNYVPDWPILEHGLTMDKAGNFWIGGNYFTSRFGLLTAPPKPKESPLEDRHILKFSPDGKQLLEIGKPSNAPVNNQDTSLLGSPSEFELDEAAHEIFIADGYINSRIVVYDSETGAFKRGWGAYGMPLSEIDNGKTPKYDPNAPPPKQFIGPLIGLVISEDGLVYVRRSRGGPRASLHEGRQVREGVPDSSEDFGPGNGAGLDAVEGREAEVPVGGRRRKRRAADSEPRGRHGGGHGRAQGPRGGTV